MAARGGDAYDGDRLPRRRSLLPVFLSVLAVTGLALVPAPRAAVPLAAGHYGGPASATWSVVSSPRWLGAAALKLIARGEGLSDLPAKGSCEGVVGLDVPGDGGPITGLGRCEFAGELARYNDRVVSLKAAEGGDEVTGSASCCGAGEVAQWTARRVGADGLTGSASGSTAAPGISVETRFGDIEVSLRVDWTVRFAATRAE